MGDVRFNPHWIRSKVWSSVKGTPVIISVTTQKGVNFSIIGCILPFGTINFLKVEPLKPAYITKIEKESPLPANKIRRAKVDDNMSVNPKKGTTAYHVVTFVQNVMDVLYRHNKLVLYRHG